MTEREYDILRTLTRKVRYLSAAQLARGWWKSSRSGAVASQAAARSLIERGLLFKERLPMEPELDLKEPIFTWRPGEPHPNPWELAARLRSRWTEHATVTTIFFATWTTARLFGGYGGGVKNTQQVTHDVHLSQIYLLTRRRDPDSARKWEPDDLRKAWAGQKVPDVFIRSDLGEVIRVIEFGGKYDGERVGKFHAYCSGKEYPYELW